MVYEASGNVEEDGEGVDQSWFGNPVIAMTRFGGQAELVSVPLKQIFEKPEQLTFEQGAAIPVNYLTAWALLVTMGGLQKDEAGLISNAGGGGGLGGFDMRTRIVAQ